MKSQKESEQITEEVKERLLKQLHWSGVRVSVPYRSNDGERYNAAVRLVDLEKIIQWKQP